MKLHNVGPANMAMLAGLSWTPYEYLFVSLHLLDCQDVRDRANVVFMKLLVSLVCTKGGCGKSTLASHLAIWFYDRGFRVALLDTDSQQTAAKWIRNAEPNIPVVTAYDVDAIRSAKHTLHNNHEIIIADSPGKTGEASGTVALLSDYCVVPLQPSLPDLRAIHESLKFIRLAQELSSGHKPQATLVLSFTAKGDTQTRLLREQLVGFAIPVAKQELRRLNAFRDSADSSVTRQRSRDGIEAAKDIEALFSELFGNIFPITKRGKQNDEVSV